MQDSFIRTNRLHITLPSGGVDLCYTSDYVNAITQLHFTRDSGVISLQLFLIIPRITFCCTCTVRKRPTASMDDNFMRLIQQTDMSLRSLARARSQLKGALMQSWPDGDSHNFQMRTACPVFSKHKQLL